MIKRIPTKSRCKSGVSARRWADDCASHRRTWIPRSEGRTLGAHYELKAGRPGSGSDAVESFLAAVEAVEGVDGYWYWTMGDYACRLSMGVSSVEFGVRHDVRCAETRQVVWTRTLERLCDAVWDGKSLTFAGKDLLHREKVREEARRKAELLREREGLMARLAALEAFVSDYVNGRMKEDEVDPVAWLRESAKSLAEVWGGVS